ncbi:MAG: ATP-binding protein [Frankia sp.]
MAAVELRFSPLDEHVRTARLIAAAVGRRSRVAGVLIDEVKLAVGEACARAVALHRRAAPDELVLVRLIGDEATFTIEVRDYGPTGEDLPPTQDGARLSATQLMADDERLAAGQPTGLGLAIIEGLVDHVEFAPAADGPGTVVTMSWPLPVGLAEDDLETDLAPDLVPNRDLGPSGDLGPDGDIELVPAKSDDFAS